MYFLIYLKHKNPTEYTSMEELVATQRSTGQLDWFPLGRAICLMDQAEEDKFNVMIKYLYKRAKQKDKLKQKNIHDNFLKQQ